MPAGITQVAIAASTISANRIVYADGSQNPRFFSDFPAATAGSLIVTSGSESLTRFFTLDATTSSPNWGERRPGSKNPRYS